MRRLACCALAALLAGCTDAEPLAAPFAGEWASAKSGCGGPRTRIRINRSGIAASGMPIDGLSFTKTEVSGSTAHLVMVLSPTAAAHVRAKASSRQSGQRNPADIEIRATLIASGPRITPTNILFRDRKTGQLQAADRDVLAILTLVRCRDRAALVGRGIALDSAAG